MEKETSLPLSLENFKEILRLTVVKGDLYSHSQVAIWCQNYAARYRDEEENILQSSVQIAEDIDAQWELYLSNSYSLSNLSDMDFNKVKLPLSWFENWHDELQNL